MDMKTYTEPSFDIQSFIQDDDNELEFNMSDFNISDIQPVNDRYIKPKISKKVDTIKYENAASLAKKIKLSPGEQIHGIVKGNFIFGDFIEALLYEKKVICEKMYLSTLSLSQNNIDSLSMLLNKGYIKNLVMVVSNYFYSHYKNDLMKYLLKQLDIDNRFDIYVIRNHTKICLMEISNIKLILSGSSNLRSSMSIEQFILQEDKELYQFYKEWFEENSKYSIINKEVIK